MGPLALLVGPLVNLGKSILNNRHEAKKQKLDLKARKIQLGADQIKAKMEANSEITKQDFELAHAAINDWKHSYKDEVVLGILILPLLSYFLYGLLNGDLKTAADSMVAAFSGDTYYSHVVGAVFAAIYGLPRILGR